MPEAIPFSESRRGKAEADKGPVREAPLRLRLAALRFLFLEVLFLALIAFFAIVSLVGLVSLVASPFFAEPWSGTEILFWCAIATAIILVCSVLWFTLRDEYRAILKCKAGRKW